MGINLKSVILAAFAMQAGEPLNDIQIQPPVTESARSVPFTQSTPSYMQHKI